MVKMIDEKEWLKEYNKTNWLARLLNYWSMEQYENNLDIKAWEVYEIDFGINVGHEFSGRHYGVVINDSPKNNPLITRIPIKTAKKKINKKSDVLLNEIEGIKSSRKSVAVINQIQTIDKLRIFSKNCINIKDESKPLKLNKEQIKSIKNALYKQFSKM